MADGAAATAIDAEMAAHDARMEALGFSIWVGAEPTFTDRFAETPEWLTVALGDDKSSRARRLLAELRARTGGGLLLRSLGRQYPKEDLPRWSLGLYQRRDRVPLWCGPPDPLVGAGQHPPDAGGEPEALRSDSPAPAIPGDDAPAGPDLAGLAGHLCAALDGRGFRASVLNGTAEPSLRVWFQEGGDVAPASELELASLRERPSLHTRPAPHGLPPDTLAAAGRFLLLLDTLDEGAGPVARIELPAFGLVARALRVLDALGAAAREARLPALILCGYPPPVDASVAWTTVTPDPAVVEVNAAPYPDVRQFFACMRRVFAGAAALGLAPYRLYYNGNVADSGGGGQLTLGGPSPEASPFLTRPGLLPALVRYSNRHPSLSYRFAPDYLGSSSQSVRPDERGIDALRELRLTLALLERLPDPEPEALWRALSSFLADATGNTHRAELNIEKLWNPYLAERGRLGLVEFRAFRMQASPERAAALAALLRAVVALQATGGGAGELLDWGADLHERFALPFYLDQDFHQVLADLEAAGLGLGPVLRAALLDDEYRVLARVDLPGCRLTLRRALEFWPLVGDAASQEHGTSRLVDASSARLELRLEGAEGGDPESWQVAAEGVSLPLRREPGPAGPVAVYGLRYRSFYPHQGLHPGLGAHGPVHLRLRRGEGGEDYALVLHEWRPDGLAYGGLPLDLEDARQRRHARCVVTRQTEATEFGARAAPPEALSPYCLDLRWL